MFSRITAAKPVLTDNNTVLQIRTIFFIQILYCLFELYVYDVSSNKLVNLPTKMAASSVERC